MKRNSLCLVGGMLFLAVGAWGGEQPPQAVSPGGSFEFARVETRCPTFSWGMVKKARSYELVVYQVDERILATEAPEVEARVPVFRVTVPGTAVSWTPAMDRCLGPGRRYAWFVRALGKDGAKQWSKAKLFEVVSAPSIAEVEEALRVLRRYADTEASAGEAAGPVGPVEGGLEGRRSIATGRDSLQGRSDPAAAAQEKQRSRRRAPGGERARLQEGMEVQWPSSPRLQSTAAKVAPTLGTASLTVDEQVHLGAASSLFKDGALFLWSDDANTALGAEALSSNTIGENNTATGFRALQSNTTGFGNTAAGSFALFSNTSGGINTATGDDALAGNTTGSYNTATGAGALEGNTTGISNTASGVFALGSNSTGAWNTATGVEALFSNSTGGSNTATGAYALLYNTEGSFNTASGVRALYSNTTGSYNTASGYRVLYSNTTGSYNTATGYRVLHNNTTGLDNTASGYEALLDNTTGSSNTATGVRALRSNTTGSFNTAGGRYALANNITGFNNTASGSRALGSNTTGLRNTAVGAFAGSNATTGSDNIFIGYGANGVAEEANTIRIGGTTVGTGIGGQNRTFINGIRGVTTGVANAIPVLIDSAGQLGTASSSRRFKKQIADMGEASEGLLELRPVTFRYRQEPVEGTQPLQFGLIAEEVAEVLPDLVVYDEAGRPYTVRYHVLIPMLLNELQKQHEWIREQENLRGAQERRLREQQEAPATR